MDRTATRRDRAATERRLLDAARAVFSEAGYDGASIRDIATRAKANPALISRYFGGKEGLFFALTQEMIDSKMGAALPYPPCDSVVEEVRRYLTFRMEEDAAQIEMIRLLLSKLLTDAAFRKQALDGFTMERDKKFRARLERLQEMGRMRRDLDAGAMFVMLDYYAFTLGLFSHGFGIFPPDEVKRQVEMVVRIVVEGVGPEREGPTVLR